MPRLAPGAAMLSGAVPDPGRLVQTPGLFLHAQRKSQTWIHICLLPTVLTTPTPI